MTDIPANTSRTFDRAVRAGHPELFERDGQEVRWNDKKCVVVSFALSPSHREEELTKLGQAAWMHEGAATNNDASNHVASYIIPVTNADGFRKKGYEVLDEVRNRKTASYIVTFADTVTREEARAGLKRIFACHAAGRIVRESELIKSFTVDGVDGEMLNEINHLSGLYGVDDNIQFDLA